MRLSRERQLGFIHGLLSKVRPHGGGEMWCRSYGSGVLNRAWSETRIPRKQTVSGTSWARCAANRELRTPWCVSLRGPENRLVQQQQLQSCRTYTSNTAYHEAFAAARHKPEEFWGKASQDVSWFEPWERTLHVEDPVFPNW